MKAVIPAKTSSSRVPNKNWREFCEGVSLIQIKMQQLIDAGLEPEDIWVFCEDESKREIVEDYCCTFFHRPESTVKDNMHWSDVVTYLVGNVDCPDDETVAWIMPTTPLFNADDYRSVFHMWETMQGPNWDGQYDSLITVKPLKEYVLDGNGKPMNFSFGRWHEWSQDLPQWFIMDSPVHLMKKETYMRCNYYIGERPYMYVINKCHIDIDTVDEFEAAQILYKAKLP